MNKLNIYKWLRVALLTLPLLLVALSVFRSGTYDNSVFLGVMDSLHIPVQFFSDRFVGFYCTAFDVKLTTTPVLITYLSYIVLVEIGLVLVRIPLVLVDLFNLAHNTIRGKCDD